jgi:hypothetical protein
MIVDMGAIVLTTLHWVFLTSLFIPLLVLMGISWILGKTRSMRQERTPLAEKLLRSPGESLRRELEKMNEQVNDIFIWTFFGPALIASFLVISSHDLNPVGGSLISAFFIGTAATIGFAMLVWRLIFLIKRATRLPFRIRRRASGGGGAKSADARRVPCVSRCADGTVW